MVLFGDVTQVALESALDNVALRQRVTASNLSNAATPGYHAQRVDFESALASALRAGEPANVGATISDANTPDNGNGNTVSMENESTALMRNGLQYQSLVQAVNYRFDILRSAIGG